MTAYEASEGWLRTTLIVRFVAGVPSTFPVEVMLAMFDPAVPCCVFLLVTQECGTSNLIHSLARPLRHETIKIMPFRRTSPSDSLEGFHHPMSLIRTGHFRLTQPHEILLCP